MGKVFVKFQSKNVITQTVFVKFQSKNVITQTQFVKFQSKNVITKTIIFIPNTEYANAQNTYRRSQTEIINA